MHCRKCSFASECHRNRMERERGKERDCSVDRVVSGPPLSPASAPGTEPMVMDGWIHTRQKVRLNLYITFF